ncbi:Fungal-trans domain-containing protein [Fusarium keratoplasticum]|uniref:Fungal-trans domain-containing protein n=1 Tax=Fusarium keratoplasticum TaxID=1328300 RepID=A0ACC0QE70_9HYPO|nr:Fungal-trans domain-containing protein [Fusarium keratoplasticum]KAI8650652.1 Fungal-trans domain-containing protein [Fusarium keratoplasticum]
MLTVALRAEVKYTRPRKSPKESQPSPASQGTDGPVIRTSQSLPSPTSPTRPGASDYYLTLARQRLTAISPDGSVPQEQDHDVEPAGMVRMKFLVQQCINTTGTSLSTLSLSDWMQVIQVYEDEIGLQYPFLDIQELQETIRSTKQGTTQGRSERHDAHISGRRYQERLDDILTLIFYTVSILADPASAERSKPSVESIYGGAVARSQLGNLNEDDLVLIILGSIFFFLGDQEILAWRGIGMVFRLLQELEDTPDKLQSRVLPNDKGVISPEFYWSVYTLDRRWSFGTGLPFAVQDSDVRYRPSLKDNSLSCGYLKSMVAYCEISSEVQKSILETPQSIVSGSKRDFLNFRVVQWQQNLPQGLCFSGIDDKFDPAKEKRGEYKMRLALYLRANQMRIIIHRKFMARSELNTIDATEANVMASITRDSIRVLMQLARDTDIYIAQQKTFNHFLETALSSLLLIMCSTEDLKRFSYLSDVVEALELVEQLASQSAIMQNMWCKMQSIKEAIKDIQTKLSGETSSHCGQADKEPHEAGVVEQEPQIAIGPMSPTEMMMVATAIPPAPNLMEEFDSFEALEEAGGLNFANFPELGQFLQEYENFYF